MITIPNLISFSRILLSAALLFFPACSPPFYLIYISSGLTDMVDGTVARKTGTVSAFGSLLDSAADFVFFAVCLVKLVPILLFPAWLSVWIVLIALIKAGNVVFGFVMQKKPVALHTALNKITGVLLFLLPLTLSVFDWKYSAPVVCAAATLAAVQENHLIRTGKI